MGKQTLKKNNMNKKNNTFFIWVYIVQMIRGEGGGAFSQQKWDKVGSKWNKW